MNVCGIVCEYNPFHNGHLYHINHVREFADAIVCVMSGNYVQRGEPAIIRKHLRAKAAVLNGADLVIELPTPWSTASAECFASGAIHVLTMLPSITHLSFGCETNNIDLLIKTAKILNSHDFSIKLKEKLQHGISFAAARSEAVAEIDPKCSKILELPNNILGIEYLKALNNLNSEILPMPILRKFVAHDSEDILGEFASASAIRTLIKAQKTADFSQILPCFSEIFEEISRGFAPASIENAERAILAVLKRMSADDYLSYPDVSEGLHKKIKLAATSSSGFSEAVEKIKSKRYAHARIRRILLRIFLGVTSDYLLQKPPYLRVLALNDTGRALLDGCTAPIITKPAAAKELTGFAKRVFDLEVCATELYSLFMPQPATEMNEWNVSPIYIPGKHN